MSNLLIQGEEKSFASHSRSGEVGGVSECVCLCMCTLRNMCGPIIQYGAVKKNVAVSVTIVYV